MTGRIKIPNERIEARTVSQGTTPSRNLAPVGLEIPSPDSVKCPSGSNSSIPNAPKMDRNSKVERTLHALRRVSAETEQRILLRKFPHLVRENSKNNKVSAETLQHLCGQQQFQEETQHGSASQVCDGDQLCTPSS